jgi:hypothetical protein
MGDKFPNLPGVVVNITDGNLTPDITPAGPSVVVTGVSGKGPAKTLTRVLGDGAAVRRFGLEGNLGRGVIEVMQGGSENTLGYRILTTKGEIELGKGIKITSVGEGSGVFEDLALRYDHTTGALVIRDTVAGVTVYDSANNIDLGIVRVSGAKTAGGISAGKKVILAGNGESSGQVAGEVDNDGDLLTIDMTTDDEVDTNVLAAFAADGANLADDLNIVVQVAYADGGRSKTAESKLASWTVVGTDLKLTLDPALPAGAFGDGPIFYRLINVNDYEPIESMMAQRLGRDPDQTPDTFLDGSDANGLRLRQPTASSGFRYDPSTSELAPHKMNYYEALIESISALETVQFDVFMPMGMGFDDENVADLDVTLTALTTIGDNAAPASCTTFAGDARKVKIADAGNSGAAGLIGSWIVVTQAKGAAFGQNVADHEVLVRTARIISAEQERGDDSNVVADSTVLLLDRDLSFSLNGSGVVVGAPSHKWYPSKTDADGSAYHEVNFGYRVAKFCHDMTENEDFTVGVIGTSAPENSFDPAAISRWYGKSPTYSSEAPFGVETNGKGLLGNKFLVGEVSGGVQFSPGLYDTPSGYLDDSKVLKDANDLPVDLGKFLCIVASSPIITNQADATGLGYIASGAPGYAGLLASLPPWSSSTGKTVSMNKMRMPSRLAKRHQNSLSGLGYTLFDTNQAGNVAVVDAPSAAMPTSDFRRNMTLRLLGEAVSRVRTVSAAFIGEPLSELRKSALETGIQRTLTQLQADSEGALESFGASISQSALEKATGFANLSLSLQVVGELRRILVTVSLSL